MKHLCRTGLRRGVLGPLHTGTAALMLLAISLRLHGQAFADAARPEFPDAPSAVLLKMADDNQQMKSRPVLPVPCPPGTPQQTAASQSSTQAAPCIVENPLQIVVNYENRQPLTSRQKGLLAVRDIVDPFNLL